jgi:hypothetical protein
VVAPGVRLSAFAILATPDFAFAIVFIVRTSSFVHARRTALFAFGIQAHSLHRAWCQRDVLLDREVGKQVVTLEYDTDILPQSPQIDVWKINPASAEAASCWRSAAA